MAKQQTVMTAKCVICKHKFDMTPIQVRAAQATGCAMCPKCGNPATVIKVRA